MRKIVLYIAMSVDGYVADQDGGIEWLSGQDPDNHDMGSYGDFIKTLDTVILGYNTYHQVVTELSPDNWVYSGMQSYVLTHRNIESTEEIIFTDKAIDSLLNELKEEEGKDIWICGGASIVNQLVKSNMIDQYHITLIPTILGKGIRLFDRDNDMIKLQLIETKDFNGMVDLVYKRR